MSSREQQVAVLLRNSGLTLAVAESCSGGLIAKIITDVPGSSGYFLLGVVTYADSSKERVIGVPHHLLERHGAVSREVAIAMAEGVRDLAGSSIALATTGIAGPGGGSPEKPVGTVYVSIASGEGSTAFCHVFRGSRKQIRKATAEAALELLSNHLVRKGIA